MDRIDNNPESLGNDDAREERLGELINDFFDRRRSGENISQEGFLAEHPDDADELRDHFRGLDLLTGLGSSSNRDTTLGPADGKRVATGAGSSAVSREEAPIPAIPGYEVHKQIGRGGMGIVYRATQISTKRQAALKLLMEGPYASDLARKRFEREIALAAQLRHPNIIPIYDSGTFDGRMYYAMEYVRGHSLTDYLRMHRLDVAGKLRLFAKVCGPVRYAHQRGVVHRDIKPSNVLIDADGEPHILDFGLAKAAAMGDMTASVTAQILGTPAYMSPEQASGDTDSVDIRTDIYSLGIVLYEMLTANMPYETNVSIGKILDNIAHAEPISPTKRDKRITSEVAAIVMKSLEKSKFERYQSLDAFADDVNRYLAGEPISVRPATASYILRKALVKHRTFVGIAASLFLVGAVFGLVLHHMSSKLSEAQVTIRTKESKIQETEQEKAKYKHEAEDANQSREVAERQRAFLESLLPPEWGSVIGITKAFGEGMERGEDPNTFIGKVVVQGIADMAANQSAGTTPVANATSPAGAQTSPTDAKSNRPTYELSPEVVQLLRAMLPTLGTPQQPNAATQPAPIAPTEASRPNPTTNRDENS